MSSTPVKPESMLHLDVLPPGQRKLWDELGGTPSQFVLYGGTAIALRLGHRQSVDFDFFTDKPFDTRQLLESVPYLSDAEVFQQETGTLSVTTQAGKGVKVSFFCPRKPMQIVGTPYVSKAPKLRLAPLIDLAATKLNVIFQRASAKDYLDIHALLTIGGIDLLPALVAADLVFPGQNFNPFVALKALTYFGDMDLSAVPHKVQTGIEKAASKLDMSNYDSEVEKYRRKPELWKGFP